MPQPETLQIRRLAPVAVLAGVLAAVGTMYPQSCDARSGRHGLAASLVRCTSLRQPMSAHDATRPSAAHVFAPTRQAVFFSHAGDRCVWHAGTPARG